jgi:hypothetical protein
MFQTFSEKDSVKNYNSVFGASNSSCLTLNTELFV